MNSRKPRGSGRTPAVGRRGGPFQERDFQRQIGARRGAAAPREEAPFDEDAVPRTRGRRGRGAGAARAKAAHLDRIHDESGERLAFPGRRRRRGRAGVQAHPRRRRWSTVRRAARARRLRQRAGFRSPSAAMAKFRLESG